MSSVVAGPGNRTRSANRSATVCATSRVRERLRGVVAVPVVISASPAHAFVSEHLLRPLLVELGARAPLSALAITEGQLGDLDSFLGAWLHDAAPVLGRLATA